MKLTKAEMIIKANLQKLCEVRANLKEIIIMLAWLKHCLHLLWFTFNSFQKHTVNEILNIEQGYL